MIKIENTETYGWEAAIRGMRNPKNSWDRSDSRFCADNCDECQNFSICQSVQDESWFKKFWEGGPIDTNFCIGPNDYNLMKTLQNAGTDHRKFMRMIMVSVDITAPLYWWKEFDTYKVGTVANSCSTMHKIHAKEFVEEDFSFEHIYEAEEEYPGDWVTNQVYVETQHIIQALNVARERYLETKDKKYWWQMIQLLPSSYNQKRTVTMNYEVLANIYKSRKAHKLDEWREGFCDWIKSLPYSELITGEFDEIKEEN